MTLSGEPKKSGCHRCGRTDKLIYLKLRYKLGGKWHTIWLCSECWRDG